MLVALKIFGVWQSLQPPTFARYAPRATGFSAGAFAAGGRLQATARSSTTVMRLARLGMGAPECEGLTASGQQCDRSWPVPRQGGRGRDRLRSARPPPPDQSAP